MSRLSFVLLAVLASAGSAAAQPSLSATLSPGLSRIGDTGGSSSRRDYDVSAEIEQRTLANRLRILIGSYGYTRHRSTSALYRYSAHAVRLAVGLTY